MKRAISALTVLVGLFVATAVFAQDSYWVRLEANNTVREAEEASRRFAEKFENVNTFRLGRTNWYATAVGPFTPEGAAEKLAEMRRAGGIPSDSYVSDSSSFGQQIWPVGANALNDAPVETAVDQAVAQNAEEESGAQSTAENAAQTAAEAAPETEPEPAPEPEENRAQALRSERALDRPAREALQVALQWEGYYSAAIDGAFGPGTRNSMAQWQAAKGYEQTGVLTTKQRAELLGDYQDMLASLGLADVTDEKAGIKMMIPVSVVSFDRYEAPFAHYEGDKGVRVVLISQSGDRATLFGLYDILQTLEVVPAEGERARREQSFTITGEDGSIVSYTEAKLVDGAVKGFMLVWPKGDEKRRSLVLEAMRDSFTSTGTTVLDDNAGLDVAMQSVDLVSGLEIRRADRARTGFFVDGAGAVLTTTEAVAQCREITLDESYQATVVAQDASLGIALLKPNDALAPVAVAEFLTNEPRIQSALSVAGFSFGGRLSSATLTFGALADVRGLDGGDKVMRLDLEAQDGDAGGPVMDAGGAVVGMLQAAPPEGTRQFPPEVSFAVKSGALAAFLGENGVSAAATDLSGAMTPHDLSVHAADLSVLVSCWK